MITKEDLDRMREEEKTFTILSDKSSESIEDLFLTKSMVERILDENEEFSYTEFKGDSQ